MCRGTARAPQSNSRQKLPAVSPAAKSLPSDPANESCKRPAREAPESSVGGFMSEEKGTRVTRCKSTQVRLVPCSFFVAEDSILIMASICVSIIGHRYFHVGSHVGKDVGNHVGYVWGGERRDIKRNTYIYMYMICDWELLRHRQHVHQLVLCKLLALTVTLKSPLPAPTSRLSGFIIQTSFHCRFIVYKKKHGRRSLVRMFNCVNRPGTPPRFLKHSCPCSPTSSSL